MDSFAHPSISWLVSGAITLIGSLSFALLGYSLQRMRSRDRLAVTIWWVGGALAIGAGLWCMQALGLIAVSPQPSPQLHGPWLLALLAGCALSVAGLQLIARTPWPDEVRWGVEAFIFAAAWFGLYELGLHALSIRPVAKVAGWPLHFPAPAFAVMLAGMGLALWGLFTSTGIKNRTFGARLWSSAVIFGLACAASQEMALSSLQFSVVQPEVVSLPTDISLGTALLGLVGGVVFVLIGLTSAWLDTLAQQRNRLLTLSLNEANLRLRDQALSDPLTKMPNRLLFEERMQAALVKVGTDPCSLAVLFVDLDGFKPINDSFGHVAGDAVLSEVGRRLQAMSREEDTVARVGGDEFLLMTLRPGQESVAATVAQRLLQALSAPFLLPNGVEVNLSASIGIVMYPEHGPAGKLIANADAAMYAAKRAGGSTYAFFEPRMELDVREQLELQHDLRSAIERKELTLYYQPKIDGRSGLVTGAEALIRWHHPVRGFVPPGLFIPVAERFGLIGAIGNWVINEACRQLREWIQKGLRMRVAVNLSMHQLRQDDLVPRIRAAVERFGIDPQLLTFEITESVAMEDTQETMRTFEDLASVGVSLSIDDFGTGYSSLSYLRKLPAKQLKIDQSFVQDLGQSADALAVVDAVIKLAHALGLTVVAEGVETARQRDMLLALQCDELQGYLFARPMSAKLLTTWAMGESIRAKANQEFRPSLFMELSDLDTAS